MNNSQENISQKENEFKLHVQMKALEQKNNELKMRLKKNESQFNDYTEEIKLYSDNLKAAELKNQEEIRKYNEEHNKTVQLLSEKINELTPIKDSNYKDIKNLETELQTTKISFQDEKSSDSLNTFTYSIDKLKNNIEILTIKKDELELEHCENIKMINHLNLENDQLKEHLKIKKEEIANVKERVEERECYLNLQHSQLHSKGSVDANKVNSLFDEVETKRRAMNIKYNDLKGEYEKIKNILKIKSSSITSLKFTKSELSSKVSQFELESTKILNDALLQKKQDLEKVLHDLESKHNESYLKFTLFGNPDLQWCRTVADANDKIKQTIDSEIRNKSISMMLDSETLKKMKNETHQLKLKYQQNLKEIEEIKNNLH